MKMAKYTQNTVMRFTCDLYRQISFAATGLHIKSPSVPLACFKILESWLCEITPLGKQALQKILMICTLLR